MDEPYKVLMLLRTIGRRIVIASGEGAKAALAARQYVLDIRKKKEVTSKA